MKIKQKIFIPLLGALITISAYGQNKYELNTNWKCSPIGKTKEKGEIISKTSFSINGWQKAVVPGTVLTTQLANKEVPDPFFGMNNEKIPDIYDTGRDYYTYWFVNEFNEKQPAEGQQVWLTFRGINYSCDIFLNGKKVNSQPYEGMFLRKTFNITSLLSSDGKNRLAVIVFPPNPVGKPNGGQGGDGRIAKNVSHQYVAGWDWIQPIRDRNTGIWDKVFIEKTGIVNILNPHVVTLVPGIRKVGGKQADAILKVSTELQNASSKEIKGTVKYTLEGEVVSQQVSLKENSITQVSFPDFTVKSPKLWWPSGTGAQPLYNLKVEFVPDGEKEVSDTEHVTFGIRQLDYKWNLTTRSKEIYVNGQRIFIKGGNWIISDAMLRFSDERYDTEVRYHRDMNLNLIRIWGGALTERPEFYNACDKYGMLVLQDFWFSGDCNGRWPDPMKADDQWTRRKYPDNHKLVLESAADMIKMIRNHPSLAMWCGGNEIAPPEDILVPLRDSLIAELDGTRWFIDYSNSDDWSENTLGGNGDGPYTIQPLSVFWQQRTFPFNSEVGSVGVGDYESLERFLPKENMTAPRYNPNIRMKEEVDPVWTYHTYTGVGYEGFVDKYGKAKDIHDFAMKAQLINYDQYRGLIEGFTAHKWDWYTGVIIWKTQNPWTSMRGQMYDYYLDPNASLFGLRTAGESLHPMCNPITGELYAVNSTTEKANDLIYSVRIFNFEGKDSLLSSNIIYLNPSSSKKIGDIKNQIDKLTKEKGGFLLLRLINQKQQVVGENFYWLPDSQGEYTGLQTMNRTDIKLSYRKTATGKIEITMENPDKKNIAFFNRVSVIDKNTGKRILPAFYSDNYISLVPGAVKVIEVEFPEKKGVIPAVENYGWNVPRKIY